MGNAQLPEEGWLRNPENAAKPPLKAQTGCVRRERLRTQGRQGAAINKMF